jgi:hypothetical protein
MPQRPASGGLKGYYVDWYDPHILCLTIGILLLRCADGLLTLYLLERGEREVNALINLLINTTFNCSPP